MDLSKLSDADLLALKAGDLSKVSNEGLLALKPEPAKKEPGYFERAAQAGTRGLLAGGPAGAMMAVTAEGLKTADQAITKGAYEAGGAVTDVTGSPALGYATNVGIQAIPALASGGIATKAAPAFRSGAESLMQSALKPPLSDLRTNRAAEAISTMLDEGVNVTRGGVNLLRGKISDLNQQILDSLKNSPAYIDKASVWKEVRKTLETFTKQVNPQSDMGKIRAAWDEFLSHPLISGDRIPVQTAQELKQGTYRMLSGKYGELGSAETEAQKALARGLKEEISTAVPGISDLNAAESKLINALNMNERRVLMSANKNPMGLAVIAHNPAAWALFMADRSELFKSLMARMLNAGQERIPQATAGVGVAGVQAVRGNQP